MNPWLQAPRVEKAEADVFTAERAERRGDFAGARSLYSSAADAFASTAVAVAVPADYPNTRSDLAIAAMVCLARAGDLGRAIEFAERMLAEGDALTPQGRSEIRRLGAEYAAALAAIRSRPDRSTASRGLAVRDEVRGRFKRAA